MVDSKAVYLYREVDYSQYLVVDSKAVCLYREVVHRQSLVVDSKAVCLYREVVRRQYLVVDSKAVYHNTRRWHHPKVASPKGGKPRALQHLLAGPVSTSPEGGNT